MSILERSKDLFSPPIRERGTQYYQKDRVEIDYEDDRHVMAVVQGSEVYDIDVELKEDAVWVSCTCPYAEKFLCQHIYAVLLKIERENLLPGIKKNPAVRLQLIAPEEPLDDRFGGDQSETLPVSPQIEEKQPGWSTCLDNIRTTFIRQEAGALPMTQENKEIIYVIRQSAGSYSNVQESDLVVNIFSRSRKKNGEWGPIKSVNISTDKMEQMKSEDAKIISVLLGARSMYDYTRSNYGNTGFIITQPLAEVVLPKMSASGRLFFQNDRDETLMGPLSWHPEEVWRPRLVLRPDPSGSHYECVLELISSQETMPVGKPEMITRQGVMMAKTRLCRIEDLGAFPWIEALRGQQKMIIPKAHISDFIEKIYALPGLPPVSFPEELRVEEVLSETKACLVLRTRESHYYLQDKKRFRAKLYFRYRGCPVDAWPFSRGFYSESQGCYLLRDAEAEKNAHEMVVNLGFKTARDPSDDATYEIDADKFARVVSALTLQGWHVEADGKLYREAGSFTLNVTTGIDWFELHAACDFENQKAGLPILLAALQKKQNLIELPDGTLGVIPEEVLKKYALLAQMGEVHEGHLRFKKNQAGLLDALLASGPEVNCDALFEHARQQLHGFSGIEPAVAPESFQGVLRRYQEEALGWFEFLRRFNFGGCLADDMGLGKTVQVLALLEKRRLLRKYAVRAASEKQGRPSPGSDENMKPSLVVAPRSVIFNWRREAGRFTPRMRVLEHTGLGRKASVEHFEDYDLVLTTYGTLRRDAVAFRSIAFDYVILDEAQAIKNSDTASAKAVRLLKANHRLALSGTPVENHVGELWSLFEFLNPGLLGSSMVFKRNAADPGVMAPETRGASVCSAQTLYSPADQGACRSGTAAKDRAGCLLRNGQGADQTLQRIARSLSPKPSRTARPGGPGQIKNAHSGSAAQAAPGRLSSGSSGPEMEQRHERKARISSAAAFRNSGRRA